MAFYTATVSATSNSSGGTDDTFVEILAAASSAIRIHRIEVGCGTAATDTQTLVKLSRATGAGATGTAYTPLKRDNTMRDSGSTVKVKNGTNAFTVGAGESILESNRVNTRGTYRWLPTVQGREIYVAAAAYFDVVINCPSNSIVHTVTVEWEE